MNQDIDHETIRKNIHTAISKNTDHAAIRENIDMIVQKNIMKNIDYLIDQKDIIEWKSSDWKSNVEIETIQILLKMSSRARIMMIAYSR